VLLEQDGASAFHNQSSGGHIAVDERSGAIVDAGGPLTNSVVASRHGPDLLLDYKLIGAGGRQYQLSGSSRSQPPEFAVFKGDKKIASGKFEFG